MYGRRRSFDSRLKTWLFDNWFRLLVLLVAGVGGMYSIKTAVAQKVEQRDFDEYKATQAREFAEYKAAEALRAADLKRDLLEIKSTQSDIQSVICIGQERAPGCQRMRRE